MAGANLQSIINSAQNFVQAINSANQIFGKILRNIKPGILLGNSTGSDGLLQAITLDGSLRFSNTSLGVQTGIKTYTSSHALVSTDYGYRIEMNVSTANTLTINLDSTTNFDVGTAFVIDQIGAGQTQFVAASGVTLRSAGGATYIQYQYGQAELYKRAANEWLLTGEIAT